MLRQALHIGLSMMLLMSTMGITMHKHYCMGRLKTIAINEKAESCLKDMDMECPKNCCDDEELELSVDDLNKTQFELNLTPDLYPTLLSLVATQPNVFHLEEHRNKETIFLPPKPPEDIPIKVQSFLL